MERVLENESFEAEKMTFCALCWSDQYFWNGNSFHGEIIHESISPMV